jgi:riboflavin kinase/FMN adenylyltransferase
MRVTSGIEQAAPPEGNGRAVAIGNFDGFHRGHQFILERLRKIALQRDLRLTVLTFWPHPLQTLKPERALQLLMTREEKLRALEEAGVEEVIEQPFSAQFASVVAEDFYGRMLKDRLKTRMVSVGPDFCFGKGREGTFARLKEWGIRDQIEVESLAPQLFESAPISSTRIRQAVAEGSVFRAYQMLGRAYAIEGEIVRGEGRGKTIGVPTANLLPPPAPKLVPARGVYITALNGMRAVTNVGVRPTVSSAQSLTIETHVFDRTLDLYGQRVELCFYERLRDEKKFESVDALRAQIAQDLERARKTTISKIYKG